MCHILFARRPIFLSERVPPVLARLGLALVLLVALALGTLPPRMAQAQGVIYVDQNASGANDGSSWADAYVELQSALAAASAGDAIWVAQGTYRPDYDVGSGTHAGDRNATFQLQNGVALYGGFPTGGGDGTFDARDVDAYPTALSGDLDRNDNEDIVFNEPSRQDNSFHVITGSGTDATAILDGLIVAGGNASEGTPHDRGGGMYNASGSPTVRHCTFSDNTAWVGGGMYNEASAPTLSDVVLTDNVVGEGGNAGYGGGMYNANSSPTLIDVTFSDNYSFYEAGGICNWDSSPTLRNVTFSGNVAQTGGGMHNENNSNPALTNVTFRGNTATYAGGGMRNRNSSPTLANVVFSGNTAPHAGGGMHNENSAPTLIHTTFSRNTARYGNGGGMHNEDSSPTVDNSIFWGNRDGGGVSESAQIHLSGSSAPTVAYSLIQGGWSGSGSHNLSADPQFVDADGHDDIAGTSDDDLRLRPTSPAVDAGDNDALPADAADLDDDGDTAEPLPLDLAGNPRSADLLSATDAGHGTAPIADMGAYENATADLWIVKDATPDHPLRPGDLLTYTLIFANDGTEMTSGVAITDIVPAQLTDLSVASDGSSLIPRTGVRYAWDVSALAPGQGGVITITGRVNAALTGPFDIANAATIAASVVETDTADNRSSVRSHVAGILYVDASATGTNNGSSWTNAYTSLQSALAAAQNGDEIWVAAGTYRPTGGRDRAATFQLQNGVAMYGGFAGLETDRNQRDWEAQVTVLSGDIGTRGNDSDNSFHVVNGSGTDATAILNGFTVSGGNANGDWGFWTDSGGGMLNDGGSPMVRHCTFRDNAATASGGGMFNHYSSPTLSNVAFIDNAASRGGGMCNQRSAPTLAWVTFHDNSASYHGGGMDNEDSDPALVNVAFTGNTATYDGGGVYNLDSDPTLVNVLLSGNAANRDGGGMCNTTDWELPTGSNPILTHVTFSGNTAGENGGGMYNENSDPAVQSSIFWGNRDSTGTGSSAQIDDDPGSTPSVNYSLVQGGYAGTGNVNANPQFVDADGADDTPGTDDDDLRLRPTSPAVDAGDNDALPADTADLDSDEDTGEPLPCDLACSPRAFDVPSRPDTGHGAAPIVDMGAYETAPNLALIKTADDGPPEPGQRIAYTIVIHNSGLISATGAVVSDTLPTGLTFAGPVVLDPPQAGAALAQGTGDLPTLASGLVISAGERITITLPVTVNVGLAAGKAIVNDAAVTSTEVATAQMGSVELTVANVPPTATDDEAITDEDMAVTISVLANDGDLNGDALSLVAAGTPLTGTAAISGTAIVYTPAPNDHGTHTFTYTASDGSLTDTATITVTITPVNDPPLARDDAVNTVVNTAVTCDVLANDSDPDGDPLSVIAVGTPATGTATTDGATVTFTPTADLAGSAVFTYTVSDGALMDTATVTVTIVSQPPMAYIYLPLVLRSAPAAR